MTINTNDGSILFEDEFTITDHTQLYLSDWLEADDLKTVSLWSITSTAAAVANLELSMDASVGVGLAPKSYELENNYTEFIIPTRYFRLRIDPTANGILYLTVKALVRL